MFWTSSNKNSRNECFLHIDAYHPALTDGRWRFCGSVPEKVTLATQFDWALWLCVVEWVAVIAFESLVIFWPAKSHCPTKCVCCSRFAFGACVTQRSASELEIGGSGFPWAVPADKSGARGEGNHRGKLSENGEREKQRCPNQSGLICSVVQIDWFQRGKQAQAGLLAVPQPVPVGREWWPEGYGKIRNDDKCEWRCDLRAKFHQQWRGRRKWPWAKASRKFRWDDDGTENLPAAVGEKVHQSHCTTNDICQSCSKLFCGF